MRRIIRALALVLALVLLIGLIGGFTVFQDVTQGPLPDHDGEFTVAGLNDRVEIFRDEWGVPHVYATNTYDLFFAQGYTQAQDRWWQMEFFRHTGSGAIQELTGRNQGVMGTDVFLRTLGFRDLAERELAETYTDEAIAVLQAFSDGVNAYIMNRSSDDLAMEYSLLGLTGVDIEIEPWTLVDTIIWGKVMALSLGGNYSSEQLLSEIYESVDEALIDDWLVDWPYDDKPTIVWEEDLPITPENAPLTERDNIGAGITGINTEFAGNFQLADLENLPLGYGEGIGSNNWVAHGDITESGMPLLANDMHLSIQMPSIWYEIGLHCQPVNDECPYNMVGFVFAPSPGITAGHNEQIAWAHTNVGPDTQDLYQIRVNPDNPLQYEWNGEWRDMVVREETLNFGDGGSATFDVRITHLGPIINDNQIDDETGEILGFNNDDPLALRWTSLEPGALFDSVLALNRATNWEEFREALRYWDSPSQNIIYADTEGNIGYQVPGRIPVRGEGHTGLLPVPGWTDEYEWRGYIPYDSLPRIWNPERGYIATANQALVPPPYYEQLADDLIDEFGEDADYTISRLWAYGYRGERINTLLEDLAPHTAETFQQIHGDNYDGSAAELLPLITEIDIADADLADMRDWLVEWDYQTHMDSPRAALYGIFWQRLVRNLYNDQFGDVNEANGRNNEWWSVYLLMQEPDNPWWDDVTTGDVTEIRDDIVIESLRQAVNEAVDTLGDDRDEWRWGALHTTTFVSNPLGESGIQMVEDVVNRGPVETSGTSNAVNATSWSASSDGYRVSTGPSERVIYDLSDWSRSLSMHTTGQSGHPYSQNYDDMIDPWRNIAYRTMLWTREQVESAALNTLILIPEE